jgi:thiol-disulfide isomerase/thioredoxin
MTDILILLALLMHGITADIAAPDVADPGPDDGVIGERAHRYTPQPIPCGPDAPTHSNFVARVAEPFYLRFTAEAFRASPEAAAPYAADAERLLRETAFGLATGWRKAMADLYARTPPLIEAGCINPTIVWMHAQDLVKRKKQDDAKKSLARLLDTLNKGGPAPYSPLRALTLFSLRGLDGKAYAEEALADALAATLTDGTFRTNETRVAWAFIGRCEMTRSQALLDRLRAHPKAPDPFLVLMLQGTLAYRRAWDARGSGYAYNVTEEGWKGFGENIKEAQAALVKAWELHPEIPQVADLMIDSSRGDAAACRLWFDRAVAAELDYMTAYDSYVFTLRPRWGGSLAEMLALAEECRATERHDTDVPLKYVGILFDIADELKEDWQEPFQKPGVYANCTNILAHCFARTGHTNWVGRQYFNTALAYAAHAAGDYDAVARAAGALSTKGGQPAYDTRVRPPPPFNIIAMSLNGALTGPNKKLIRAAEQQARGGDLQAALQVFENIRDNPALKLSEYERYGIAYWEMDLARRIMLASGDWCSLIRPHNTKHPHGAWVSYYNSWSYSNMTFRAEGKNACLSFNLSLPRAIEYEIAFMPLPADPQAPCSFGFALDFAVPGAAAGPALWLAREGGKWSAVWVRRYGAPRLEREQRVSEKRDLPALPPDGTIRLSVTSENDAVTAVINGETVFENLDFGERIFYDPLRTGRAPYLLGSRVAVTALKARPLVSAAQSQVWLTHFEKAKAEAAQTKRPIFAFFTGSDWCVWCVRLKKEALDTKAFTEFAADNLILFEADFPQGKEIPPELKRQNEHLMQQYSVRGFPTVLLLDAEGKELRQTGYQEGGAQAYVKHLKELLGQVGIKTAE